MTSPPKQYTRDDVLALIRDFISKDIGEHEAWEAWKAIKKTRSPEVVDLFEGTLVRMANVPYTLELGKRNYWASSAAVKRLSRIPAMAERAARDVEWVSSSSDDESASA